MDHGWLRLRLPKHMSVVKILKQKADVDLVYDLQAQLEVLAAQSADNGLHGSCHSNGCFNHRCYHDRPPTAPPTRQQGYGVMASHSASPKVRQFRATFAH